MGVPTMYVRLLEEAERRGLQHVHLPQMRLFISGSAPLSADVFERFEQVFGHKILERYGMTETAMNLSTLYAGPRLPGTVGVPLPGVSVRVVDERGDGVLDGEVGELVLCGPNVFRGYWRAPEKTAEAFFKDTAGERWFRTGDLGKRDPTSGYYMLLSRRHDLIISGGFNIYPREIEELLSQHPAVLEAAVVGIPDGALGQVPVAFVVRQTEQTVGSEALIDYCRAHLARYKIPRSVTFLNALPRNAMGKIEKHKLIDQTA
jgi:malonyl-CoA/methylmalonyl-CoA synthetase